MSTDDALTDLPEDFLRRMTTAVERLLRLPEVQRGALFEAVKDFRPSTALIARDEAEALATSVGVDVESVESAVNVAAVLRETTQIEGLTGSQLAEQLKHDLLGHGLIGAAELLDALRPVADAIEKSFTRIRKLESAMPALERCRVACDLRYLAGEKPGDFELAPMAIVRLELDENDDAVFHCTPEALKRLIKTLQDAAGTLDLLDKIAQQRS